MTTLTTKPIKDPLMLPRKQPALNDSLPEELERLIASSGVDWTEKLINRCEYRFNPIPVVPFNSSTYQKLIYWSKILQDSLKPAEPEQILAILARLRIHFTSQMMNENENEILVHDYLADLSHFPFDLILQAYNEYRYEGSNTFFPRVGQLRQMINIHLCKRLSKLNRLTALIEVSERNANTSQKQ